MTSRIVSGLRVGAFVFLGLDNRWHTQVLFDVFESAGAFGKAMCAVVG